MVARIAQVGGAALIAFGAGMLSVPAGVILAGIFAVLIGVSLERGRAG